MPTYTRQETNPLHIENTVNSLAREELALPRAFETYRRMLNDEVIGGGMNLTKSLINKREFKIETPKNASAREYALINALNNSLNNLEGMNKVQFLNYILSMLDYGLSMFETVFKRDESGFSVYNTFSPIHPINVQKYVYKKNTLDHLMLNSADNDGLIVQESTNQKEIRGEKVLMFKLNADLDNPLGQSMLARCYKPWKARSIAEEYELIGVAKNLSGVLKVTAPSEYISAYYSDPSSDNALYIENLLEQAELLHSGKSPYAFIASDTTDNGVKMFDIATIGGEGNQPINVNEIIGRYEANILNTLYANIITLGQSGGGSFALADSKTNLLTLVIDGVCNTISESFKEVVKIAYALNNITPASEYPTLKWGNVENIDFDVFSRGLQRLVKDGIVESDDKLEEWVRTRMDAPEKDSKTIRTHNGTSSGTGDADTDRDNKEA